MYEWDNIQGCYSMQMMPKCKEKRGPLEQRMPLGLSLTEERTPHVSFFVLE
uniref:Uncharacterized protein n=1 Tax=Medicago truncatula TaxID=3880 RepID=A2Q1P3_MEDTR|nr:hypothetical protein MtrDRAFT_AC148971g24v2 [Medicago truncatula]